MDFKIHGLTRNLKNTRINAETIAVELATSLILVLRNFFLLIFYPYRTMRKIALTKEIWQTVIIFGMVFIYFKFVYFLRDDPYPATFIFSVFLFNFLITVSFFYFSSKISQSAVNFSSFVFTFSYTLLPTLIWFMTTSILYVALPPPRTLTLLGKAFSLFFTAYSISLLAWKLILFYLAIRFSTKANFFKVLYLLTLYLLWFIPYSLLLYNFKVFRIPFI